MATPLEKLDPVQAWQPAPKDRWGLKWAAHLYRRAGFGVPPRNFGDETPAWESIQQAVAGGRDGAIDHVLAGASGQDDFDGFIDASGRRIALAGGRVNSGNRQSLRRMQGWWFYRMLHTPHPLRERLTLFWHDHFATSVAKVRSLKLMFNQHQAIRTHALGKFQPFLLAMSRDPAMIVWLDNNSNVKAHPNENYAREVMELFSLGVGNYTEKDIQEAARAFTGWSSNDDEFIFNSTQHDFGRKTVLGNTGNFNGEDIVRIVLEQPVAARFLVRKLFHEFINDMVVPPDELIEPLAERFRSSGYDIADCMRTLLRSRLFFSEHAYRQRIKGPVEYVVGLVRSLDANLSTEQLAKAMESLGQSLFEPPNVAGWKGGKTWLNSATLVARHNLAWRLLGGKDRGFGKKIDVATLASKYAKTNRTKQVEFLLDLLVQGDVSKQARSKLIAYATRKESERSPADRELRDLAHTIVLLPEYQLS